MNWTEPKPPTKGISFYDHVICETPLGKYIIEWKSWKTSPDYGITLEHYGYIGTEYSLEAAKIFVKNYLIKNRNELYDFLK